MAANDHAQRAALDRGEQLWRAKRGKGKNEPNIAGDHGLAGKRGERVLVHRHLGNELWRLRVHLGAVLSCHARPMPARLDERRADAPGAGVVGTPGTDQGYRHPAML